jgi:hypothetical protein
VELYENTYRGLLAQHPAGQLLDTADSAVRKGPLGDFSQRVLIITAHQQRKGHSESYGAPYLLQQLMAAKVVPHGKQSAYINIKALKQLQLPDVLFSVWWRLSRATFQRLCDLSLLMLLLAVRVDFVS